MRRLASAAVALALTSCRADPAPRATESTSTPSATLAPSSAASPEGASTAAPAGLPADLPTARRSARRLFTKATLEPDRKKARALFLAAADALPPGGPALYQAGRMAARDGDADEARRLFGRAREAIQRSTRQPPRISPPRLHGTLGALAAGAGGRLVLTAATRATVVRDAIGYGPRFVHDAPPSAAALSDDGTLVVTASGKRLLSCSLVEATCSGADAAAPVVEIALSGDGEVLAARTDDGRVEVRDAATLALRSTLDGKQGKATALALPQAGDRLFVGLASGSILRVRADTGEVLGTRRGHEAPVVALAFDAGWLVSADARSIRTGPPDAAEGELFMHLVEKDDQPIVGLAVAFERTLFVVRRERVEAWSLAKKERVPGALGPDGGGLRGPPLVARAPGRLYVALNYWGVGAAWLRNWTTLEAYDLREPLDLTDPKAAPGGPSWEVASIPQVGMRSGGSVLAIYDDQCATRVWDLARGAFVRSLGSTALRNCPGLRLSPDGKTLFTSEDYTAFRAIDVAAGTSSRLDGGMEALAEPIPKGSPEGAESAVEAGGVLAWTDAAHVVHAGPRGGPYRTLGKHLPEQFDEQSSYRHPAPAPALSPKGALVAIRTAPDRAEIWETLGSNPPRVVRRAGVSSFAFGADDAAFVGALDGTVTMIRGADERVLFAPDGAPVFALAPVGDGRVIAGAVVDDTAVIHLWSARDGALRATLVGGGLATTPDGRAELFGSADGDLGCAFGPFVFGLDLCREALVEPGLLARSLAPDRMDP